MSTVMVSKDGKKFKVLIDFVQRGVSFSGADLANSQAIDIAEKENIHSICLYKEA